MVDKIGGKEAMDIINAKLDEIETKEELLKTLLTEYPYNIKETGKIAGRLNKIPINFGVKKEKE